MHTIPRHFMAGFSLLEMIVVLILVGILSAGVGLRTYSPSAADAMGFAEQVRQSLRYAQKTAVAKRRTVYAKFNDRQMHVTFNIERDASTVASLIDPATDSPMILDAPSGIQMSGSPQWHDGNGNYQITFNPLGVEEGGQIELRDGGSLQTTVIIESKTGYVH